LTLEQPQLEPESFDCLIVSASLEWVNDLPGTLSLLRRALKPDGVLLASMLGGDTLNELRQAWLQAEAELTGGASPRVAPFADVRETGSLLQRAGLALPVVDADRLTVRYASALNLMQELKSFGLANATGQPPPRARAAAPAGSRNRRVVTRKTPTRTGACAPRSRCCISPAGHHMTASPNHCGPARPKPAWPRPSTWWKENCQTASDGVLSDAGQRSANHHQRGHDGG
jgi:hypothetical protein